MGNITTVTRKGQVTIPADIRRELNIQEGDRVAFSIVPGQPGTMLVRPVESIAAMTYGIARAYDAEGQPIEPFDLHDLRERVEKAVAEDVMNSFARTDDVP